jgi:hypothetical protein
VIEHLRDKGLGVGFACRVLGLSESAYYARKKRPKSARQVRDEQLMPLIEQVHAESGGTYGVRRITRALKRKGVHVARCTVERLMAELGLEGVIRGQRRRTTVPEPWMPCDGASAAGFLQVPARLHLARTMRRSSACSSACLSRSRVAVHLASMLRLAFQQSERSRPAKQVRGGRGARCRAVAAGRASPVSYGGWPTARRWSGGV